VPTAPAALSPAPGRPLHARDESSLAALLDMFEDDREPVRPVPEPPAAGLRVPSTPPGPAARAASRAARAASRAARAASRAARAAGRVRAWSAGCRRRAAGWGMGPGGSRRAW
jgi:hypothetical protein